MRSPITPALATGLALALAFHLGGTPDVRAAEPAKSAPAADSSAVDRSTSDALNNLNAPGPQHRRLAALAGKWTTTYRVRTAPGTTPAELPGTAEYRMDLGGLFLIGETTIEFGEIKGRGLVVYGFDRFKNRYSFLYLQDHDTQVLSGLGVPSADGKSVVFDVAMDVPAAGQAARHYRTVLSFDTLNQHTFSMSESLPDGREYTPVEIVYTRVP